MKPKHFICFMSYFQLNNHNTNMSVCFSYLWRFWRRKSALLGFCLLLIIFVIGMQYSATSKQEEHLFVSKTIKKSGSSQQRNQAPNNYFNGAKKLQYNLPSLVEEPPSYPYKKYPQSSREIGVHFVPRDKYNRQSNNRVYNNIQHKQSHSNQQQSKNSYNVRNENNGIIHNNNKNDWKPNSIDAQNNKKYEYEKPLNSELSQVKSYPKSAFEESGYPQPANIMNGEYEDTNNNPQPAIFNPQQPNYYYPAEKPHQQPYRVDRGNFDDSTVDPNAPPYIPKRRLIHLDLKGAPPKIDYLIKILKMSSDLGATGVVLEYEDMFPFGGILSKVAATNHYNVSDIKSLLDTCEKLNLEVIPLVQTFGHMEFILKLAEFKHLRDAEDMPESICSCDEQAMPLLEEYINQVMAMHPNVQYLHIGCDEVFHMGECESCVIKGQTRSDLFVQHVQKVATFVKQRYKVDVIIWDDMLRNLMAAEMQPLAKLVEPMVWVYAPDVYQFMPTYNWDKLAEVFDTAWTASAFKGAHGPTLTVPPIEKHITNTVAWLNVMKNEATKFNQGFQGIVLTGWQRYDHFAVLCETLPASIPSLVVNLVAATNGYLNSTLKDVVYDGLRCATNNNMASSAQFQTFIDIQNDPYLWDKMSWCFFPGVSVFKLTHNLDNLQYQVKEYIKKVTIDQGWLTDFNIRHNFSSPFRVQEGMDEFSQHIYSITSLMRQAKEALSEVFDYYTVAEWIEQKIYPMYKELSKLKSDTDELKSRRSWPKRPFEPLASLKEFGIGAKPPSTKTKSIDTAKEQLRNQKVLLSNSGAYSGVRLQTARPKRLVQQPDYYRHPQKVVVNSQ